MKEFNRVQRIAFLRKFDSVDRTTFDGILILLRGMSFRERNRFLFWLGLHDQQAVQRGLRVPTEHVRTNEN
jgi:hypothetical protein